MKFKYWMQIWNLSNKYRFSKIGFFKFFIGYMFSPNYKLVYVLDKKKDAVIGFNFIEHNRIKRLVVDEEYRGKGIGKNIIRKAIELSKNENCYKVILQSGMKRERAHTFYEKLGFDGESKKAFDLRLEEN